MTRPAAGSAAGPPRSSSTGSQHPFRGDLRRLAEVTPRLRCPTCGVVGIDPHALRCPAGHHFVTDRPAPELHREEPPGIFDRPRLYRARNRLHQWLNPLPLSTAREATAHREVLDLGCGPLQYVWQPADASLRVGIDRAERALIAAAEDDPRGLFLRASLLDPLPFADASFDVCLLLFVLHHLPPATVPGVVAEALRVARREIVVYDHQRSDIPWQWALQRTYWNALDRGDLYRSASEWEALWEPWRVLASHRLGRMFGNVVVFRIGRG
jgi:SAM-dependent methyltransferase